MQELTLDFKGYCLSTDPTIPTSPGVYVIYETEPNTDKGYGKYMKALRYIGQAKNLHDRIRQHAIDDDYPIEDEYFYTYATVPENELKSVLEIEKLLKLS